MGGNAHEMGHQATNDVPLYIMEDEQGPPKTLHHN